MTGSDWNGLDGGHAVGLSQEIGWIGVDVGTHAVKLAQVVRAGAGVRLHRAAAIQRPSTWSSDDSLAHQQPITSHPEIRAALECGGFEGRNAVCSLPMNVCQLRSLHIPPGSDDERRTIIADELAEEWAELNNPMEFDFWEMSPVGGEKQQDAFNVSVLAASKLWIDQTWRDCRRAGLDCWAIDGAPLATARAVGMMGGFGGGRRALAIDWGFSNTTMCVVGDDRPLYSRRIHDCSFGRVLEAIMTTFDISLDEAQHLAEVEGLAADAASPSGTARAITQAISHTLNELVRQVSRTLQFTEMQRKHLQPAAIWVLGGGGALKNVQPYLQHALALPVHVVELNTGDDPISCATGSRSAVFGNAAALSALAWRSAA